VLYVVFVMLQVFLSRRCYAQVKNASLPLVMWHGMGRSAVQFRNCLFLSHTSQIRVNSADRSELWNFRSHVLSLPGAKVP